jgi:hypothetical protein
LDWLIDLEISLIKAWNWSLYEIDRTDIESLLPFIFRMSETGGEQAPTRMAYCDQVGWL